jgi:hypothetical protein
MILAAWLLSLPFRFLAALGLRRSIILACLFILAVTAYGVAEDLGVLDPPARAAPARKPAAGHATPSRAAVAEIPAQYLRLYCQAGGRYRIPWSVLAAIGKVESDHGRSPLPGVRSGSNWCSLLLLSQGAARAWPTGRWPAPSRPPGHRLRVDRHHRRDGDELSRPQVRPAARSSYDLLEVAV